MSVSSQTNALTRRYQQQLNDVNRLQGPQAPPPEPARTPPASPTPAEPAAQRQAATPLTVRSSRLVAARQHQTAQLQQSLQRAAVRPTGPDLSAHVEAPPTQRAGHPVNGEHGQGPGAHGPEGGHEEEGATFRLEQGTGSQERAPMGALENNHVSRGRSVTSSRSVTFDGSGVQSRSRTDTRHSAGPGGHTSERSHTSSDASGRQVTSSQRSTTSGHGGESSTHTQRSTQVTGRDGSTVRRDSGTTATTRNGQTETHSAATRTDAQGNRTTTTTGPRSTPTAPGPTRRERLAETMRENAETNVTLASTNREIFRATAYSHTFGQQEQLRPDQTGSRMQVNVGDVRVTGGASVQADLRHGRLQANATIDARADLVNVNARTQYGDAHSTRGQGFAEFEGHVGAHVQGGPELNVDLSNGTANVALGGQAFLGAEATVRTGYENRYGGVEAELTGQAGIGGTARAQIGMENGRFRANVDFGACIGLGGHARINLNVNLRAIGEDLSAGVGHTVERGRQLAQQAAQRGLNMLPPAARHTVTQTFHAARTVFNAGVQHVRQTGANLMNVANRGVQEVHRRTQQLVQGAQHLFHNTSNAVSSTYQAARSYVGRLFWGG